MVKKVVIGAVCVTAIVLALEIIGLLQLKSHLKSYSDYWKHLPQSGNFTYVALGDSAAQGIGASTPERGYVGLLANRIASKTGKTVRIINLSVSGAKIHDVTTKQIPQLSHYKPDLVTLDIGGNDIASRYNSKSFAADFEALASKLPAGTVVGNAPYFGGRIRHNAEALDANVYIATSAARHNLRVADLQTVTRSRNSVRAYAPDLFHPSNTGYKNWADAYWQVISPDL